jgi:hypothetical protein
MNTVLIYISKVLANGKGDEFLKELSNDKAYFIWFLGLTILSSLKDNTGKIGKGLWLLFILSTILTVGAPTITAFNKLFDRVLKFLDSNSGGYSYDQASKETSAFVGDILKIDITTDSTGYSSGHYNDGVDGSKTPQD